MRTLQRKPCWLWRNK